MIDNRDEPAIDEPLMQHPSSIINHQSSIINSPFINSPFINHYVSLAQWNRFGPSAPSLAARQILDTILASKVESKVWMRLVKDGM